MPHKNIQIISGTAPVLVSAPHAAPIRKVADDRTYRRGAEERVDEITKILCDNLGAWGIFTSSEEPIEGWQDGVYGIYKKTVKNIIKEQDIFLVLDIHGAKRSRPFYIDYDFMLHGKHPADSVLEELVHKHFTKHFPAHKLSKGYFRKINGPGKKTLTYYVRKNFQLPALQLEINKSLKEEQETFEKVITILHSIVADYANSFVGVQQKKEVLHG